MKISSELQQLLMIIQDYNPYLVGGCVRDHLLGKEPHDFDVVVDKVHHQMLLDLINAGWSTKLSLNGSTEIWNVSKKFPVYDFVFYKIKMSLIKIHSELHEFIVLRINWVLQLKIEVYARDVMSFIE